MIRSIYFQRYKKALIFFGLLVLAINSFNLYTQVTAWYEYKQSQTATKEIFEKNRLEPEETAGEGFENTRYDYRVLGILPFTTYEEYLKYHLAVFSDSFKLIDLGAKYPSQTKEKAEKLKNQHPEANEYDSSKHYTRFYHSGGDYSIVFLFLVPLAGFLLFFIDGKTSFNQFLFSLPFSKKRVFWEKLRYIGLPMLGILLISQLLFVLGFYFMIPAPYMNATFWQLLRSVFSNFCLLTCLFSVGVFLGSALGNLISGPLSALFLWYVSVNYLPSAIDRFFFAIGQPLAPFGFRTFFITVIGKTGGHWYTNLGMLLVSGLSLLWAAKEYRTLSLENNGHFLLYKRMYLPVWFLTTCYISAVAFLNMRNPHTFTQAASLIFMVGICCFILVFFPSIRHFLEAIKERRTPKNSKKKQFS